MLRWVHGVIPTSPGVLLAYESDALLVGSHYDCQPSLGDHHLRHDVQGSYG